MKKYLKADLIAAACFAVMVLFRGIEFFSNLIKTLMYGVGINILWRLMELAGVAVLVALAALIFMKKKDIIITAVLGARTLLALITLIINFRFGNLLQFLAWFTACAVTAVYTVPTIPEKEKLTGYVQKLWFVPAAILAASSVLGYISSLISMLRWGVWGIWKYIFLGFFSMIGSLVIVVGVLALCAWFVEPEWVKNVLEGKKENSSTGAQAETQSSYAGTTYNGTVVPEKVNGHIDMAMHIILLFLAGGIWQFVWIYKTTKYLNQCEGSEYRDPVKKLLLCIFVPFYTIYWTYKSAERIDKMARQRGIMSDLSTICLVLAIFVSIVPPILMQGKINDICKQSEAKVEPQPEKEMKKEKSTVLGVADEIMKYKELMEQGIITEEEFEEKKKQLLSL